MQLQWHKAISHSLTNTVHTNTTHKIYCSDLYTTIYIYIYNIWGTRWHSWLTHCAKSRKVAGSIPDEVIEIFHWRNPSGHTVTLGLTQSLTEISTRNISWGWRRPVPCANNRTTFMCRLSWNLGASNSWNPLGHSRSVMGLLYLIYTYIYIYIRVRP